MVRLRPVFPLCRAHLLGVIDTERHDLFEIHVLPCIESVRELRCVQVRRSRDHHGVQRGVLKQPAIVRVSCGAGNHALGAFEALRVNVGEGGDFRVGAGPDLASQLHAAVARSDDPDADAISRTEYLGRSGRKGPRESGSDFADKIPAGVHIF